MPNQEESGICTPNIGSGSQVAILETAKDKVFSSVLI
jgi:hypothetical protein